MDTPLTLYLEKASIRRLIDIIQQSQASAMATSLDQDMRQLEELLQIPSLDESQEKLQLCLVYRITRKKIVASSTTVLELIHDWIVRLIEIRNHTQDLPVSSKLLVICFDSHHKSLIRKLKYDWSLH